MTKRVLFLDTVHPILEENFVTKGFICDHDYDCDQEQLKDKVKEYYGLVVRGRLIIDRDILDQASQLKFIARSGSGLENIDIETAEKNGITVVNSPEGNKDAVGEHALGMLLSLLNHLPKADREVRNGIWKREENRGRELGNMNVGIIGYGNTGSAFAEKLLGFGCNVLAHDIQNIDHIEPHVSIVGLQEIYSQADVLSLHIPYNERNHHYANAQFFNSFEKPIYFLNTSRGKVLNTADLVNAIKSDKVLGAGIDVLEYESHSYDLPNTEKPEALQFLQSSERVILSPHIAGWTKESYEKLSAVLLEKLIELDLV